MKDMDWLWVYSPAIGCLYSLSQGKASHKAFQWECLRHLSYWLSLSPSHFSRSSNAATATWDPASAGFIILRLHQTGSKSVHDGTQCITCVKSWGGAGLRRTSLFSYSCELENKEEGDWTRGYSVV